ncbi:recombination protein RecT [Paenibacillus albicereus]|uniref:Recombination protein RecT n=1 Tax=Paenibacillus albicereus TaxID=2726185 RepID=A0A6H2GZ89_9BACL|nr:recombination protein RecT [Paenibacillus albicereus]QJC52751.1 recombination protein RecT [Paenibacillus albicereus]
MTKTVDQSGISNQLANQAAGGAKKGPTIGDLFEQMKPAIAQAIPQHMTPERLLRIATTSIRTNPKLKVCTPESLLGAVMQCAQLGLEPSVLGHAYLVPYTNRKKDPNTGKVIATVEEAQFQIGYKGLLELARRTGQISSIVAHEVYENDLFEYEYGTGEKLRHVPADGERGTVTKYYAYAKFKDGGYSFLVMSKKDIEKHRDKFSKAKYGPWVDHFDEMAKKTVLKGLMKYMPISVEFAKAVSMDETTKREVSSDMSEVIDVTDWQPQENEEPRQEIGESAQ